MELDETSLLLLGLLAFILLAQMFFRPSAPLVHPILLGRQAEASRVRNAGESATYTNSLATSGLLSVRPSKDVVHLRDIVKLAKPEIKTDVMKLAGKLAAMANRLAASKEQVKVVALACDETQNLRLALACQLVPGLLPFLLPQDIRDASAALALKGPDALVTAHEELVSMAPSFTPDLDACDYDASMESVFAAPSHAGVDDIALLLPAQHSDEWTVVELSHLNMTAAIYNLSQSLLSQGKHRLDANDGILSGFPLASPLGFALATTAIYVHAHFQFTQVATPSIISKIQPTVLFCSVPEAISLHQTLYAEFADYPLHKRAYLSKLAMLREGYLSRDSMWDWFPLKSYRNEQRIGSLRALVVLGDADQHHLPQNVLDGLRILFSAPVLYGTMHALQPVPLTLSRMHDFLYVHEGQQAVFGPPSVNVEAKAIDVSNEKNVSGQLLCRGPAIVTGQKAPKATSDELYAWWDTGRKTRILTNGCLASIEM